MIQLDKSLDAWGTAVFVAILKQEISQLGVDKLPLQQGLSTGNYVSDAPITVSILCVTGLSVNGHSATGMEKIIRVKAGIFYQGIIGGCSCTDDPTPISDINEYCEVQLDIDTSTANTKIELLRD